MNHDIYIFGSAVRGEVFTNSDIDVLVIPAARTDMDRYPKSWSVYSRETVATYYSDGRLIAWHFHLEARCVYSVSKIPWLETLGTPAPYRSESSDIEQLHVLLNDALREIRDGSPSLLYELGLVYTAVRDIAMSASWRLTGTPCFSRRAPYMLTIPCPLPETVYDTAMMARHCSTRGGDLPNAISENTKILLATPLDSWVYNIMELV